MEAALPEWMHCESLDLPPSVVSLLRMGGVMQKDDDYFRDLLFELEAADEWLHFIEMDEDDPEQARRYFHAMLLADAGALAVTGRDMTMFRIRDQGYTLIGVMRDDTAWGRVKKAAQRAGGYGAKALLEAAEDYARAKVSAAIASMVSGGG